MTRTTCVLTLTFAVSLLSAACGDGGRAPAEAAITAAQSAFDTARASAKAYVPDHVKDVEGALAGVRATFAKGDYMQALSEAQELPSKISALTEAATTKKADVTKSWEEMSASLPGAVVAIQSRVDEMAKARRLPAGTTTEAIAKATRGLDAMTVAWNDASSAFTDGNLIEAVTKGQGVKAQAAELMASLGMPVPDALKQ